MIITENKKLNGIEISFTNKPDAGTLTILKGAGFRWHRAKKIWYAKKNNNTVDALNELKGSKNSLKNNNPVDDIISVYSLTRIDNIKRANKTQEVKDVAKECKKDILSRFPFLKISVKSNSGHVCDSIYVNIISAPYDYESDIMKAIRKFIYTYIKAKNTYSEHLFVSVKDDYRFETKDYTGKSVDILAKYNTEKSEYERAEQENKRIQEECTHKAIKAVKYFMNQINTIFVKDIDSCHFNYDGIEYDTFINMDDITIKVIGNDKSCVTLSAGIFMDKEHEYNEMIMQENQKKISEHIEIKKTNLYIPDLIESCGNKKPTLDCYKEAYANPEDIRKRDAKITKEIHFTDSNIYNTFCDMLLYDFDFIAGTGGSSTDDARIQNENDYYKMTKSERESVKWYSDNCILVCFNNKPMFVIDAQGYSYARYVYLIDNDKNI